MWKFLIVHNSIMTARNRKNAQPITFPKPGEPLWDFYIALDNSDLATIKHIFTRHDELRTAENLSLVLINGVQHECGEMVDFALDKKTDVNYAQTNGDTALGTAVRKGDYAGFLKLLKAGGNPHEKDADGRTLLEQAEDCDLAGAEQIARMLRDPKFVAAAAHLRKKRK